MFKTSNRDRIQLELMMEDFFGKKIVVGLRVKKVKKHSIFFSKCAKIAENSNETFGDLLVKPIFEKGN